MIGQWFPYTRLRRDQNCTRVTAFILALLQALGWIFLRLESPNWQALQAQHKRLYPHLANKRPSIGDPLRYAIQTVWLLFVRPIDENHQMIFSRIREIVDARDSASKEKLGEMLAQGKNNLQAPWLGLTGFAVISLMLSLLIFVGEAVRDAFDPRKAFK